MNKDTVQKGYIFEERHSGLFFIITKVTKNNLYFKYFNNPQIHHKLFIEPINSILRSEISDIFRADLTLLYLINPKLVKSFIKKTLDF